MLEGTREPYANCVDHGEGASEHDADVPCHFQSPELVFGIGDEGC